jgi:hypothetical protein
MRQQNKHIYASITEKYYMDKYTAPVRSGIETNFTFYFLFITYLFSVAGCGGP